MEKTKHIELIKPHRHAGRDYKSGATLELPATKADWRLMALLVLLPFTGLLARSGMPGYSLWLLLHLVAGHVFLWCAPHCRFARLLR